MNELKIVTCTGYGGTGSSVISDLLKEYDTVKSMGDFEFSLTHEVDGISDLQHYIVDDFNRLKTTEALYRFKKLVKSVSKHYSPFFNNRFDELIEQYVTELTDVKWNGFWHQHIRRTPPVMRYLTYIIPNIIWEFARKYIRDNNGYEPPTKMRRQEMILSYGEDKFFYITRKLFDRLSAELNTDGKAEYIVMDQLVPPFSTSRYLNYFTNLKIIVIDRDPRDLYLLNKLFWNEGWIPSDDVQEYIKWFALIRSHQQFETENPKHVLRLKFEDCVLNYDETIQKIENFIGLASELHTRPKTRFNPDVSVRNIRLWEKIKKHKDDIKEIQVKLSKFCYT